MQGILGSDLYDLLQGNTFDLCNIFGTDADILRYIPHLESNHRCKYISETFYNLCKSTVPAFQARAQEHPSLNTCSPEEPASQVSASCKRWTNMWCVTNKLFNCIDSAQIYTTGFKCALINQTMNLVERMSEVEEYWFDIIVYSWFVVCLLVEHIL